MCWGRFSLGGAFPRKRVWSGVQKDSESWAGFLAILQEFSVTCTLSSHCVLPSGTGDYKSQFVILIFIRRVHQRPCVCIFLFLLGHPEILMWPALGQPGMHALLSFPGELIRVPATFPNKECCLLILSNSGNLHSRAACQNTGQVNMSFDYTLTAAKDSLNLIHK